MATGRSQQRQGGQKDRSGANGSSLNVRKQNVAFHKVGNCRQTAGQKRRHTASLGSCRPTLAREGQAESGRVTEIIKVDSDSSDGESLEEMEERLARMLQMKSKRRRGEDSLE